MFERVNVIGRGRVGSALASRLAERGIALDGREPDLVVICVPDRAISEVAAAIAPGPWITHVSGATPLAALDPHTRRFGMHPLQTFTRSRGAEQLDGAWAAVSGEGAEGPRQRQGNSDADRVLALRAQNGREGEGRRSERGRGQK